MARTHYANGDEITLGNCDGCSPSRINGVFCHETGCPDAWRDHATECFECGCEFFPEEPHQNICEDCANPEPFDDDCDDDMDEETDD
jgi:hypothetical protein